MPISRILIPQDVQMPGDEKGKRKKTRTEELRSGTLYGQYQLRGSILTIKDASTTTSGYMAFGTDMTTIPTSPTTGTGVYIDYRGIVVSGVSGDVTSTAYYEFTNNSGVLIGKLLGEYGASTSAGAAAGVEIAGYSDTNGRNGFVKLTAIGFTTTNAPGVTVTSDGVVAMDMRSGSNATVSTQAVTISTQTSTTNAAQNGFYLDAYTSGTAAVGFGSQLALRGEDNGGTIRDMVTIGGIWDVATSASRRSRLVAGAYTTSTAKTVMSVPYFARVGSMYNKDTSGGTEVSNTATETEIFTCSIEAGELGTDGVMRLNIGGDVQQNSGGPINLTFKVKFGGSIVASMRIAVQSFAGTGGWHLQAMVCNAASASAQRAYGHVVLGKSTAFSDANADYGTASINTASAASLSVTVQWASADATAKVFSKSTFVELFPS